MDKSVRTRHAACTMLVEVIDRKQPLDVALKVMDEQKLEGKDRAFTHNLLMHGLRFGRIADALLEQYLRKPIEKKHAVISHVLRLGVVQLLWLKTPPHAAVNGMVELTSELGFDELKGMVNAVLKRVSREGEEDLAKLDQARLIIPDWLWQSWVDDYGQEHAQRIAQAHLHEPPLDLYAPDDTDKWAIKLEGEHLYRRSIRMKSASVSHLEGFDEGEWWVQDLAASLPARLLGEFDGETVLDVCAAPGGKSAQLASHGASVIAIDRSKKRMMRLKENMKRLKLNVQSVVADVKKWEPKEKVAHILLDAPCSATGTIRRHPDLLYTKTPEDIASMVEIQAAMLKRVWEWLAPGGTMVYCVCSLNRVEGEKQIEMFLSSQPDATLSPIKVEEELPEQWIENGMMRTFPCDALHEGGMDGFFAARLVKNQG